MEKKLLVTGFCGNVGCYLRGELSGKFGFVRLVDLKENTVGKLKENEEFVQGDLCDRVFVARIVKDIDYIVHCAGIPTEDTWDRLIPANIISCTNLWDEAVLSKSVKKIIFCSSNRVSGFYSVHDKVNGNTMPPKADSRYGVTKIFTESLAQLYAAKFKLSSMCIRIGTFLEKPQNKRALSTWVSPRDLAQLVMVGLTNDSYSYVCVYGVSNNTRSFWDNRDAFNLGYRPQDNAEIYAKEVEHITFNNDADWFQGGDFIFKGYL